MSITFRDFPLSEAIQRAIAEVGYTEPTPIQAQSIPLILEGKDVIGRSHTGTGKTAAFGLPAIEMIDPELEGVQVLALCPTRELALSLIHILTVFFKIETIEAEGLSRYTPEEVIRTTGIQLEENLFRVDDRKVSQALVDTYPYIESVQLRRNLPSKLTLKITEAEPLGTFLQEDGSYVVVSGKGRVLELGRGTPPDGILVVNGVDVYKRQPSRRAKMPKSAP